MPNKTSNYQLNQWEPEDNFLRSDFNEDNAKIDAALAGLEASKCAIRAGYYMGNGAASQHIDLGFAPKAVIISSSRGQTYLNGDVYGGVYVRLDSGVPDQYPGAKLDDTGFTVYLSSSADQYTNMNNYRYHYIAFC